VAEAGHGGGGRRQARARRVLVAACALALIVLTGLPALGATVAPSRALSCIPVDIHDALSDADFAFIGRPQVEMPSADQFTRRFLFDVEVWIKGNLGSPVVISGFDWSDPQIGQRTAMIVHRADDGSLRDNPCVWTEPETLLAVAELYATPLSTNPPALLIGGAFGDGRLMALDSAGQLIGLARGDGVALTMAACPGGQRVVELVAEYAHGSPAWVAVRDTSTFEIIREVGGLGFRDQEFSWPAVLSCRDEEGTEVLLGLQGLGLDRVTTRVEPLHAGHFTTLAIGDNWAVVAETGDHVEGAPFDLQLLDLATGGQTPLAELPEPTEPVAFAFSPDERLLAYFGRTPYESRRAGMFVHLFAVPSGELVGSALVAAPRQCSCWGDLAWTDDGDLLVRAQRWTDDGAQVSSLHLFGAPDLEPIDEWQDGPSDAAVVAGGILLAIDRSEGFTQLVATSLGDGRRVALRTLATSIATSIVALPNFDEAAGAALIAEGESGSPAPVPPGTTAPTPAPDGPLVGQPAPPTAGIGPELTVALALAALAVLVVLLVGGALAWRRFRST
jgi:hypothetical protein